MLKGTNQWQQTVVFWRLSNVDFLLTRSELERKNKQIVNIDARFFVFLLGLFVVVVVVVVCAREDACVRACVCVSFLSALIFSKFHAIFKITPSKRKQSTQKLGRRGVLW